MARPRRRPRLLDRLPGSAVTRTIWRNARIATMNADRAWGWIEHGAIVTEGATIAWIGDDGALPHGAAADEHDLAHALVTPGLIDAHTHLVYGGRRADEFEMRLLGASYEDIARAGGGIVATVAATRAADDEALYQDARKRALALMSDGVTTLEIKSGYGLTLHDEARSLRVARRLGRELPLDVSTTCLAAHALPPEFAGAHGRYIDAVCDWLPALHAEGLIDAVDAFCERIAFGPDEVRRVFEASRALGLPVKLHAEQLSDSGGAALAAEFGALSCDHLEHLSPQGIEAMRQAGCVAMLLPGAYYFLRDTTPPPVDALRRAGVPIAIATDHNPGTSPVLSPSLMLQMACTLFRLTPEEALRGMTVNAARALGLHESRGTLAAGMRADFAVWDVEHPRELAYWVGARACRRVVHAGVERSAQ
jgi:imidazolonepropionase